LIIDFISKWEIEIKNAVEAEHKRNEEDRISLRLLRTEINKLRERIDDLSETLEIEKIVRKVIAWLQKWQDTLTQRVDEVTTQSNTVAKAVAVLSAKTTDLTTQVGLDGQAIARLTSELAALVLRFNALPPIPTTHEVANQTLILLQTWQNGLEILVNKINTDHTQIRIELNGLGKGLQVLADKVNSLPPVPALSVIVHAVLDALSTWKTGLETRIQALADAQTQTNNRIGELAGDITETGNAVSDLTTRVDTAEGSITGLDGRLGQAETALEAGEQRDETLEKAVEDLQKQIDEWKPENDDDTAVRLARKCLTGRGIVCGFHVQYTPNFTVKITGGTGVTSDGHLITTSGSLHFTHYREFQHTADYSWFVRKNKTLPVWEMLLEKDDESSADVRALTPQQARHLRQPFIQDKVVLVLLDPKNSAPERENARGLRYLLMRQDDVAAILQAKGRLDRLTGMHPDEDDVWAETFSEADEKPTESDLYQTLRPELLLLEIDLPRFGFYQGKDCSPDDLDNTNFPNPLSLDELYKTYDPIIHDTIETLSDQFGQLADLYHELLFPQVPVEEYKKAVHLLSAKWAAYQTYNERHESDGEAKLFYIQYFYDWMRDLVNAYHELRNELLQLMAVCCSHDHGPQSYHPRHLMLGLAWREEDYGLASPLRHEFQQPPIYNGNAARLETCRLYLRRWMIMVREFYLPDYSDDESVNRFCKHEHPDPPPMEALKITPGRFYDHPLSEQTIPYYYPVTQGTQSVHRFWNYRRAKTCTESRLLSYHANDSQDSYTSDPATIRPLFYLLDAYDFYRVEGHIGERWENWDQVVSTDGTTVHHEGIRTKLTELQRKFNLDFDIIEIDIALMVEQYPPDPATPEFNTLIKKIQGAEHTAGVPKGGTFILVTEKDAAGVKNIVWDLSLPYRCCGGLEVEASVGECYEGEANVTLRVSSPHSMDNSFKVLLDGTEIPDSPYQYSESPVQFPIPSDGLEH
ncbi:MAG TPA: hypothetical protein PK228_03920, partial [Saprospiraceae bacterium]|nr:hypothetical protein [Saprospiraceae bacterium]